MNFPGLLLWKIEAYEISSISIRTYQPSIDQDEYLVSANLASKVDGLDGLFTLIVAPDPETGHLDLVYSNNTLKNETRCMIPPFVIRTLGNIIKRVSKRIIILLRDHQSI